MRYSRIILLITSIVFGGCTTTSPNVMSEEDFEKIQNGEAVIVNNRQSHGLVGDLIDSSYKTVTGTK